MIETLLSCKAGEFTVDNTAVSVAATIPQLQPARILKEPAGAYKFEAKDNIFFKAVSFVLPFDFCLADDRASLYLTYHKASDGSPYPLEEIGGYGRIWLFSENIDQPLNVFWQWQNGSVGSEAYIYLQAQLQSHIDQEGIIPFTWPNISMLNVPASLNNAVLPIYCFLRVIHTLPLTT